MRCRLLLTLLVLSLGGLASACLGADVSFRESGGHLTLQAGGWNLTLDASSGRIEQIQDRTGSGTLARGGPNLWVIERLGEPACEASACRLMHRWDPDKRRLMLTFDSPDATVTIACVANDEGPAWQAQVQMKRGTMIGWQFPDSLEFDVSALHELVFPEHLGLAFTRSFFEPGGAGVERHLLSGRGLQQVAAATCQMRPVDDEPVSAKPGKDAAGWLPSWYLNEMPRWRVTANRCPSTDAPFASLVETEHGCWLSGYRLGGWGWLFRFGGMLRDNDRRPQVASVIATLAPLYWRAAEGGTEVPVPGELAGKPPGSWPSPPRRIGIVLPPPDSRPGAGRPEGIMQLLVELTRQTWVKDAGIEIIVLRNAEETRAALAQPRDWFALINTVPEGFPADSPDRANEVLAAIRDYVRQGGVWFEAGGGYSFYQAIVPRQNAHFTTANRDFCDFSAINSAAGSWALFGIQRPDDIYVPSRAEISTDGSGESRVVRYTHKFLGYARPGDTIRLPIQQMVLGQPHREVLREYGLRNGYTRGLAEKATPETVDKLKRSILLKVTTRDLKQSTQIAEQLPYPVLFHFVDYLRGGFDKQYPDHLPPNPRVGTPDDLSRLLQTCRSKGHLSMPYTNPTWWCVNPKGPTFEQQGEAPLSRHFEGQVYPESYGAATTQGYTICAWHPAVQSANEVIRRQFTQQYPVDILFQDQVGAREPRWDANAAAPHPGAYLEGIHRIARQDSAFVPVGTEDGHDRLINWETMFCGLSFPWLPNQPSHSRVLYEDLWPRSSWRIEPLALFLAHDKVLFYHHDLGGFVRNRRDLSITLVMGYGLSWWTHTVTPSETERDWIQRLCRLQAVIGPRCAGRPLTDFDYLAPEVIRSRWGDLEVVANLTDRSWTVDPATTLAPDGFLARGSDLQTGIFTRYEGRDLNPQGTWLIRERQAREWVEWRSEVEPTR